MGRRKIAVYAICLNEARFVERFTTACAEADVVVVADTGSTDGTQERLRAAGVRVHDISVRPWRFDDARNVALALVPGDIDICLSLDLDEVPAPGWRDALEAAWTDGATRASYRFVASHNEDGSPAVAFVNTRCHVRHGYRWRHACHEGLYPDRIEERFVSADGMTVEHFPDRSKSRAQYLPLLEAAAAEEPHNARMAHYLAREYYYVAEHERAIAEFQRYLALGGDGASERSAGMIYLARCEQALGRPGLDWLHKAIAEAPYRREPWVELAETCHRLEDWAGGYGAAAKALSIVQPDLSYMTDPKAWSALPEDLAAVCGWRIGLREQALDHARRAMALAPEDERIVRNVDLMTEALVQGA